MKRRIIGLVLALVICVGLAMPVAAERRTFVGEEYTITIPNLLGQETHTVVISGYHYDTEMNVNVFMLPPSGAEVTFVRNDGLPHVLDPYGLDVVSHWFWTNHGYTGEWWRPGGEYHMAEGRFTAWNELSDGSWGIKFTPRPESFWDFVSISSRDGVRFSEIYEIGGFYFSFAKDIAAATEQPSPWAAEQVAAAIAANLVPQSLQSSYTQAATRAEFAALAVALYEVVTGSEIAGRVQFNDTTDVNVQKMAYLGVVLGVGDNRFDPNGQLTREQAAVMLARLANAVGQPIAASAPTFADNAQMSDWAVDAVGQMQSTGIMGGVGNNMFDPQGDYTREQSIITILRLFDLLD